MHDTFRNIRMTSAARWAATAFAAALIAAGPAAADELTVKNNADVPVKVVVKNGPQEVGHADRIDKKSAGKVTLNSGISLAKITPTVEAVPLGVNTRCSAAKSGFQYEVKCDPVTASPPAAPAGGNGTAAGVKSTSRNIVIENDLKDPVTVYIQHVSRGSTIRDEHDINAGGSAVFTMPVDNDNPITEVNIVRHVDLERIPCGVSMRYTLPPSQQKFYVTPVDGSSPPPMSDSRSNAKPCVLAQASRIEKAAAPTRTPAPPPAAPAGGAGTAAGGSTPATKFVVENDLKDAVFVSILAPFTEERTIEPRQSLTFTNPVLHAAKGADVSDKNETSMEIYISRSVDMRMILCGNRLRYVIPPIPEVKFFVTRVAGSVWPPRATPGGQSGAPPANSKDRLPPTPSCELTRAQNFEK